MRAGVPSRDSELLGARLESEALVTCRGGWRSGQRLRKIWNVFPDQPSSGTNMRFSVPMLRPDRLLGCFAASAMLIEAVQASTLCAFSTEDSSDPKWRTDVGLILAAGTVSSISQTLARTDPADAVVLMAGFAGSSERESEGGGFARWDDAWATVHSDEVPSWRWAGGKNSTDRDDRVQTMIEGEVHAEYPSDYSFGIPEPSVAMLAGLAAMCFLRRTR
jgi:hypothetical protein